MFVSYAHHDDRLREELDKHLSPLRRSALIDTWYRLHTARQHIMSITKFVAPSETLDVIDYDLPDNRILECAAAASSEFIVSEDKDLLRLKEHGQARIIKVAEMLHIVQPKR